jgi:hypothetical protein
MAFDFAEHVNLRDVTVHSGILGVALSTTVARNGSPTRESVLVSVSSRRIRSARFGGTRKLPLDPSRGEA